MSDTVSFSCCVHMSFTAPARGYSPKVSRADVIASTVATEGFGGPHDNHLLSISLRYWLSLKRPWECSMLRRSEWIKPRWVARSFHRGETGVRVEERMSRWEGCSLWCLVITGRVEGGGKGVTCFKGKSLRAPKYLMRLRSWRLSQSWILGPLPQDNTVLWTSPVFEGSSEGAGPIPTIFSEVLEGGALSVM